ncbi:FAD-dependent oxidoreductase [Mucilaginibacter paludis]|uniref:FAD dependent oxidoreductase n=1 Tax=Mucilaginibacter paludis DSM 18603 TaxID=714943 RepID=H1Y9S2_9SPHI|nr:FAD-dependent oxidoreductase [Mucilaginibacter paludis]EHQ31105.1 FAD dependent oxidoreductase [Mucilaginibacter paludis DSM 18603]
MTTATNSIDRDGYHQSVWQVQSPLALSAPVPGDAVYDCLIVGGGITGLTAALLLQQDGKKTILTEAHTIGFGSTGGTSAHINTFADTTFLEAESAFGEEGAKQFAQAIKEGFQQIKTNIEQLAINCDYEDKVAYLYAEDKDEAKQLDDIYNGAIKVGVEVSRATTVPTTVSYVQALKFDGQAQFHPIKYLQALQKGYAAAGGIILENTLVESLSQEDDIHIARAGNVSIKAKKVIYATHLPPGINVFNFKCAPYRSYVMAVKLISGDYPDDLIYDMQEPYHYIRSHQIDGQQLLIVGGLDHKTGHEDPEKAFADLEKYIRQYYDVSAVKFRWSSQYYVPVDGLPYIGQMPLAAAGVYCATGYNGNGMMLGSVAARILADMVSGNESPYEKLFNPSRVKPVDSFTEFVKENADVAYHFVADRFGLNQLESLQQIEKGSGKLVEVEGKKIAAYCDEEGIIHALNPTCTHAGCVVNWNAEEKSWDCPCHGARYGIDGKVLTGPTTIDLQKIDNG